MWWDFWIWVCWKFTTDSASERIPKIGYHLDEVTGKSLVFCFFDSQCSTGKKLINPGPVFAVSCGEVRPTSRSWSRIAQQTRSDSCGRTISCAQIKFASCRLYFLYSITTTFRSLDVQQHRAVSVTFCVLPFRHITLNTKGSAVVPKSQKLAYHSYSHLTLSVLAQNNWKHWVGLYMLLSITYKVLTTNQPSSLLSTKPQYCVQPRHNIPSSSLVALSRPLTVHHYLYE